MPSSNKWVLVAWGCACMWQGAPWCFTNNAWTLSTEYLIEWGARWGPYMKKEPYRYPTCHAACTLYTFCLMPSCVLLSVSGLCTRPLPSCLLAFTPALLPFGLCPCPLPSCLLVCASALPSCLWAPAPAPDLALALAPDLAPAPAPASASASFLDLQCSNL